MSLDAINAIRETEEQAEQIRKDAAQKARDMVQQAAAETDIRNENAIRQAQADGEALLENARRQALEEISRMNDENEKVCRLITSQAEERLNEAAAFILGRVVKTYGHS